MIYNRYLLLFSLLSLSSIFVKNTMANELEPVDKIYLEKCLEHEDMSRDEVLHLNNRYGFIALLNFRIIKTHNYSEKYSKHYNRIIPQQWKILKSLVKLKQENNLESKLFFQYDCIQKFDNNTFTRRGTAYLLAIFNFYNQKILQNTSAEDIFYRHVSEDYIYPSSDILIYFGMYYRALMDEGDLPDHRLANIGTITYSPNARQRRNSEIFKALGEITLITPTHSPYDIALKKSVLTALHELFGDGLEQAYQTLIRQFAWCGQKPSPCGVPEYEGMLVTISFFHKKPYSDYFIKYLESGGPLSEELVKRNGFFNFFEEFDPYLRYGAGNVDGILRRLRSYSDSVIYDSDFGTYHLHPTEFDSTHYNPYVRRILAYYNYASSNGLLR